MRRSRILIFFCSLLFVGIAGATAWADDYTSSNFINRDSVWLLSGGISTSTNFQLISGTGQTVIGESTSTNVTTRSGFFYFPLVTSPVLSAVAEDARVTLSWTAAVGYLGFTVSGYRVGKATVEEGPFTYTNVGNVLAATVAGLTNGTAYYFLVQALDTFGDVVATSSVVAATPVAAGGGGGVNGVVGGSGSVAPPPVTTPPTTPPPESSVATATGQALVRGLSAPVSRLTVLYNGGVLPVSTITESTGFFTLRFTLPVGGGILSFYAANNQGIHSAKVSVRVEVKPNQTTTVAGVFLPPIFSFDKSQVKAGDRLVLEGQTVPGAEVYIRINRGATNIFGKILAVQTGQWRFIFSTRGLPRGTYTAQVRASVRDLISPWSQPIQFIIGDRTVARARLLRGDFNHDDRVDLIDFSILLYWFERSDFPGEIDLNDDGVIDLIDFSILLFYWTG